MRCNKCTLDSATARRFTWDESVVVWKVLGDDVKIVKTNLGVGQQRGAFRLSLQVGHLDVVGIEVLDAAVGGGAASAAMTGIVHIADAPHDILALRAHNH